MQFYWQMEYKEKQLIVLKLNNSPSKTERIWHFISLLFCKEATTDSTLNRELAPFYKTWEYVLFSTEIHCHLFFSYDACQNEIYTKIVVGAEIDAVQTVPMDTEANIRLVQRPMILNSSVFWVITRLNNPEDGRIQFSHGESLRSSGWRSSSCTKNSLVSSWNHEPLHYRTVTRTTNQNVQPFRFLVLGDTVRS